MDKNMYTKRASLGQHGVERPLAKSKSRRGKWSVGIVAVALAGLLAVGGTIAWLVAESGSVTNTFVSGQVTTDITESFDGTKKSNVYVTNKNNVPVYVRAQVIINWVDKVTGNVVADVPAGYAYTIYDADSDVAEGETDAEKLINQLGTNWTVGNDKFFYYTEALDAADDNGDNGGVTSKLIQCVKVKSPTDPKYTLSVEILTEAIQAIPNDAFNNSWSALSGLTATDGKLSVTTKPSSDEDSQGE